MKSIALILIVFTFQFSAFAQTVISCENGRLQVNKNCHSNTNPFSHPECNFELFIKDSSILESVFHNIDLHELKIKVIPLHGWGNFESQFTDIGTPERKAHMKVTLSQNGNWEQLTLKTYTHYRGGNPYFFSDWIFYQCKNFNNY